MKIFNPIGYVNVLDFISTDLIKIENEISLLDLEFSNIRSYQVEKKIRFPPFIPSFYRLIYLINKIPSQNDFITYYINNNSSFFGQKQNNTEEINQGIKARLMRTYPSLIRDYHFNSMLYSSQKFDKVIYNFDLDYLEGIDCVIINHNQFFGINLFINTKNSRENRNKKHNRHLVYSNVNYIDIMINFEELERIGNVYTYTENHFKALNDKINSFQKL